MNPTSLILDICFVVTGIWMVYRSYRRGFLQAAVRTVGYIAAAVVAFVGSRVLSEACYQLFFRDRLVSAMEEAILSAADTGDITGRVQLILDSLPGFIQHLLTSAGITSDSLSLQISGSTEQAASQLSEIILETAVHPLLISVLNGICFLILFGAAMVLVHCLVKMVRGVRHIPLVGPLNSLLGGAMGLLEAAVIWYVISVAIHFVLEFSGGFSWLNRTDIELSWIFGPFYDLVLQTLPNIIA